MGYIVNARCECGFEAQSAVGTTRRTVGRVCHFPCLCEACSQIVEANLSDDDPRCPHCGSGPLLRYDDPSLIAAKGEYDVVRTQGPHYDDTLVLTDGLYTCPRCRKGTLRFSCDVLLD